MQYAMVWDIETVPDLELMAEVLKTSVAKAREVSRTEFPKLPFHRIVCIGAVVCSRANSGAWAIESIGAPSIEERTEAELVRSFIERVEELRPQLITFNGSTFDLPVLRYRAMAGRTGSRIFQAKPYFNRYSEDAIDLCDVLSSFDGRMKVSLDLTCKIMGLSGKGSGISGAEVERFVSTGRLREVAEYCESDVVNTYRVWLRYELFRGAISKLEFDLSEEHLKQHVVDRAEVKPHLLNLL